MEIITIQVKECWGLGLAFFRPSCERKSKLPFFSLETEPGKGSFITSLLIKGKWEILGNVNRYKIRGWGFYSMKSMCYILLETHDDSLCRWKWDEEKAVQIHGSNDFCVPSMQSEPKGECTAGRWSCSPLMTLESWLAKGKSKLSCVSVSYLAKMGEKSNRLTQASVEDQRGIRLQLDSWPFPWVGGAGDKLSWMTICSWFIHTFKMRAS